MFKVTKGIPIPRKRSTAKYPFGEMEIGESFRVSAAQAKAATRSAHQYGARNPGYKFNTRKGVDGTRIWRISPGSKDIK